MINESKTDAIKGLIDEEKELYLVENFLEADGHMTNLWNLYNNKDNALRWVDNVEVMGKTFRPDYWSMRGEAIDDGVGHHILEECYNSNGVPIRSYFVYQKIK